MESNSLFKAGHDSMAAALASLGHSEGEIDRMAEAIGEILVSMSHSEEILRGAARAVAERIEAEAAAADRLVEEMQAAGVA